MKKKRELIDSFRKMDIGQELRFPLERKLSVRNTIYDRLDTERKMGKKWNSHVDRITNEMVVTRIS